jgi:hypothetical protein
MIFPERSTPIFQKISRTADVTYFSIFQGTDRDLPTRKSEVRSVEGPIRFDPTPRGPFPCEADQHHALDPLQWGRGAIDPSPGIFAPRIETTMGEALPVGVWPLRVSELVDGVPSKEKWIQLEERTIRFRF